MTVDNDEDLVGLIRAGRVVAEARDAMAEAVTPGISAWDLDAVGRRSFDVMVHGQLPDDLPVSRIHLHQRQRRSRPRDPFEDGASP